MAVYANENGNIKELTSKVDLGNGFIINGIEYLGEYLPTQRDGTFTLPKPYTSYKYLVVYDFYGKKNNGEATWTNTKQHSCLEFIDTSLINPSDRYTYDGYMVGGDDSTTSNHLCCIIEFGNTTTLSIDCGSYYSYNSIKFFGIY